MVLTGFLTSVAFACGVRDGIQKLGSSLDVEGPAWSPLLVLGWSADDDDDDPAAADDDVPLVSSSLRFLDVLASVNGLRGLLLMLLSGRNSNRNVSI